MELYVILWHVWLMQSRYFAIATWLPSALPLQPVSFPLLPSLVPENHQSVLHFNNYVHFLICKWVRHFISHSSRSSSQELSLLIFSFYYNHKSYPWSLWKCLTKKKNIQRKEMIKVLPMVSHHSGDNCCVVSMCFSTLSPIQGFIKWKTNILRSQGFFWTKSFT